MISILKHRVVPAALMSLMVIFLSSCGYHMGSMMHPQIKTVAIAEVRNETREVLAGTIMRKQLAERFGDDAGSSPVRRQVEQSQRLFFEVGELPGIYSLCGHIIKDGFGKFCVLAEIRSGQTVAVQNGMCRVIQSYAEFWVCKRKAASARMLRRLINGYFRLRIFPPDKLRRL